uniref:Uncharacterized protein n=2 Tax=Meloidogyne TaxID=189290 RepID=A0A6V7VF62_MELEN|nr:unnamed protein product [Meloidogyne enterolobii]
MINKFVLITLIISINLFIAHIQCRTRCVRARGRVICPTDPDSHFNVEVKLMDSDTLPWENDDEMGRASTDLLGNYTVEGCAGDFGAWNDPDPYILITHRCPEIGHDISVIKRKLRIPIKEIKYLPNITTIEAFVETTRLDLECEIC